MTQPIERKDAVMVGLIAWTFEITRKKKWSAARPKIHPHRACTKRDKHRGNGGNGSWVFDTPRTKPHGSI